MNKELQQKRKILKSILSAPDQVGCGACFAFADGLNNVCLDCPLRDNICLLYVTTDLSKEDLMHQTIRGFIKKHINEIIDMNILTKAEIFLEMI